MGAKSNESPMFEKTYRLRLLLLGAVSLLAFAAILYKLYLIQIVQHNDLKDLADRQQTRNFSIAPHRGDILDRNGVKLATSFFSDTIYLDTRVCQPQVKKASPSTSDTITSKTPLLVRRFKEKLARQQAEEAEKDRLRARERWERKNAAKIMAWDATGKPSREFVEELANALCSVDNMTADSISTAALTAMPTRMSMEQARKIVLGFFAKPARHMFYRKAPETLSERLNQLDDKFAIMPGFFVYEKHSKRFYPNGSIAAHVVGYTQMDANGDNIGTAGIERQYDTFLKGKQIVQRIQISSRQKELSPYSEKLIGQTYGCNVSLTIDQQLQMYAQQALRKQVGRYQALGGIALVMDVRSGEILAMASCPDFDLNQFAKVSAEQMRNRILTDPIEIGSVMKIITATLLIDRNLLNPDEIIDCSTPHVFGTRVVRDTHDIGVVPFRTAFAESSNVGLVTVGLRLEPHDYYKGLITFGLGQKSLIDLPGEGKGKFKDVSQWSALSRSSLPMGYEAALTPMQVICALGAVGNDGMRLRPRLLKEVRAHDGSEVKLGAVQEAARVAKSETCKTIRELMENVVLEGTGKAALIPGYRIGGKTGTSVKYNRPKADDDHRRYYASFAGLVPIDNPRLAIYCYVDEPQGAKYGGTVAAPVFREIALAATRILGIPPNDMAAYEKGLRDGTNTLDAITVTSPTLAGQDGDGQGPGEDEARPALPAAATASPAPQTIDAATSASWAKTLAADPAAKPAPDLRGLTISQAVERLAALGLEGRMNGSGKAVSQDPPAGEPVKPGAKILITFMMSSQGETPLSGSDGTTATHAGPRHGPRRAVLRPIGGGNSGAPTVEKSQSAREKTAGKPGRDAAE